jgi:hypothetical protein
MGSTVGGAANSAVMMVADESARPMSADATTSASNIDFAARQSTLPGTDGEVWLRRSTEGRRDAVGFAKGDESKRRSTTVHVFGGRVVSPLESIGGESLEGSGFENDDPDAETGGRVIGQAQTSAF